MVPFGKHSIVLQCDTISFPLLGQFTETSPHAVRWPKEKEESSIPTPVY